MSSLASKIAAALSGLSPETKAALAALLSASPQGRVSGLKATKDKVRQQLLDTRTVAELWLAGEDPAPRNRAYAKACKAGAASRSIKVTLADGFSAVVSSYAEDDEIAKAAAIRSTRARAMEAVMDAAHADWLAACRAIPVRPWQWVATKQGQVRTWACEVAAVASVEFLPERAPAPEPELTTLWAEAGYPHCAEVAGELSLIDTGALARRAARLAQAVETFSAAPTPAADSAETALEAPGEAPVESGAGGAPDLSSAPVPYRKRGNGRYRSALDRAMSGAASYVVADPSGFVLYVGGHREAKAFHKDAVARSLGSLSLVRLPAGWSQRTSVPLFANALAKVTGGRQRVRLSVVAA